MDQAVPIRGPTPQGIVLIERWRNQNLDPHEKEIAVWIILPVVSSCFHISRMATDVETNAEWSTNIAYYLCFSIGILAWTRFGADYMRWLKLTIGMVGTGIFIIVMGVSSIWNINTLGFRFWGRMGFEFFQSSASPCLVPIMRHSYENHNRHLTGFGLAIWNTQSFLANICGSIVAEKLCNYDLGWWFIIIGLIMIGLALIVVAPVWVDEPALRARVVDARVVDAAAIDSSLILICLKTVVYAFLYQLIEIGEKSHAVYIGWYQLACLLGGYIAGHLYDVHSRDTVKATILTSIVVLHALMHGGFYAGFFNGFYAAVIMALSGSCVSGLYALLAIAEPMGHLPASAAIFDSIELLTVPSMARILYSKVMIASAVSSAYILFSIINR